VCNSGLELADENGSAGSGSSQRDGHERTGRILEQERKVLDYGRLELIID